jgi:hypothetical protein
MPKGMATDAQPLQASPLKCFVNDFVDLTPVKSLTFLPFPFVKRNEERDAKSVRDWLNA